MVTARKREENLQSTPIAVSAFTGNELENRQITSTDQLSEVTPNLTFDSVSPASGSSSAGQIFIRGIGQTDFTPVTDPGVGSISMAFTWRARWVPCWIFSTWNESKFCAVPRGPCSGATPSVVRSLFFKNLMRN